ncbi:guided entry of tail-anchored proteins factor 1 [Aspergillus novofumigatus IBT 16806]|uniref:Protein get1 n=1 Tax=Aspergillus novofumigatus (strain IBT 16806) TaxID=1392255 RepID=A0A2I1C6G8_ASPN1|nr:protein get1 [Aspergillus novofumigatus IBT 16806]PKX93171.1 protein get1 [Aspergillus novofumigatus IBT 16806]
MLSLILTIFFVHVAIYLVNTVGATTIDTLLWILYLKLPTSTSKNAREQSRLKREVVQLKREMNNTSSQDEFAKWAKLRRKHDKAMDEYEAMNKKLTAQKTSFDWSVKIARWLSTNGLKIFLQFYYSKTPVFALPAGWFPSYVEWVLVQVWNSVCATAIAVTAEIVTSMLLQLRSRTATPASTAKAQKAQ